MRSAAGNVHDKLVEVFIAADPPEPATASPESDAGTTPTFHPIPTINA